MDDGTLVLILLSCLGILILVLWVLLKIDSIVSDKKRTEQLKKENYDRKLEELNKKEKAVKEKEQYVDDMFSTMDKCIKEKADCFPYIAAIMADLLTVHYEASDHLLGTHYRAYRHDLKNVRELLRENKEYEYKLRYLSRTYEGSDQAFITKENNREFEKELREAEKQRAQLLEKIEAIKQENEEAYAQIRNKLSDRKELYDSLDYWNNEAESAKETASQSLPKALIGNELFYQYLQSMSTTRLERSLSEEMQFKVPFELSTSIRSSSGEIYTTSLTSCTCEDFKRHNLPCKHMIALAIKVKALSPYQQHLEELFRKIGENLALISEKESAIKEMRRKQGETKAELNELKRVIEEKQQSYPWLAKLIASYKAARFDMHIRSIVTKRELTSEIKRVEREKALLANQLAVYEYMFPILNAFKELPPDSIIANLSDVKDTGFHYNWLSEEEYRVLTSTEKQQLWIKNYFTKRSKNAWEAGIKYERYIGYLCEQEGCTVKYTGALLKLNDMGRDLIATVGNTVYIIQCKRFSERKEIHENHLFQLFGSTCHYSAEHPNKKVVGVFVTTSHLSDIARECANKLDILLYENVEFKEYPVIKCNIGKTGEKIYHLPFDQQYDNVTIKVGTDEMYVATIKEAEHMGFRHAMKHKFIS